MDRLVVAVVLVVVAVAVAAVVSRRRPDAPTQRRWAVPTQLDRADFAAPDLPWLVAVFSSATCESCDAAVAKVTPLAGPEVVVDVVELTSRPDLHDRYGVDAVPTVLVADREGVVRVSYVGSPPAAELWAAVAGLREGRG